MNWKKYETLGNTAKGDETHYIIGLDIGNDSSAIAFYNLPNQEPESIDLSGGYGKPSIPTVMQYISENKEWVFGEYAVLNRGVGEEITLSSLMSRLGKFDYINVDHRSVSIASVLSLFIKEILASVKNFNPNAEIVGIVATVPAYFSEHAQEEFKRAFKHAGYEKELIAFVPDRECILTNHYRHLPETNENVLLLDFGSRELRGGLYSVTTENNTVNITSMSSVFDSAISTSKINRDVNNMFETFVFSQIKAPNSNQARQLREHTSAFSYQHKDMLFQKNITQKPMKFYFNFAYPPLQQIVDNNQVQTIIKPYVIKFNQFIQSVLDKNLYNKKIDPTNIDRVICVGGGFEMLWAKEAIMEIFNKDQISFYKNPKMVIAEGASLVAASRLNVPSASNIAINIKDEHQLTGDVGLWDGKSFLPLVERNSFWWQNHSSKIVLVNAQVTDSITFEIAERNKSGENRSITKITINEMPKRPKGVTKLEFEVRFKSNKELTLNIRDMGFGDLFPVTNYNRTVEVSL